jgi:NhaP-type Na+/H+ or K+/H+ antiporter
LGAGDILVVALAVVGFGLVSGRLEGTSITAPMVFVLLGLVMSWTGLFEGALDADLVELFMSVTLALVLFADASRIDLKRLRRTFVWPLRMLSIGLILTMVAGTVVAAVVFPGISIWEAMLVAIVLAPTDAALGAAVVNNEEVPQSIRQTLNIESGLNDGLALPVLMITLALAESEATSTSAGAWVEFAMKEIGLAVVVGLLVGGGISWLIERSSRAGWMSPLYLKLAGITLALIAFFAADEIGGSGFIAAFVAGGAFAFVTSREVCESVHVFAETEGQGLVLLVFVLYGATVVPESLDAADWRTWVYAVLSLTVIRMIPTAISLIGTHLSAPSVSFLGWFGPRGLASMLFMVLVIGEAGPSVDTPVIEAAVGVTVLLSVFLHGATAAPLARRYGRYTLTSPDHEILEAKGMAVPDMATKSTYGMRG